MTKSIGLFQAKTHLSELVDEVQHGQSIIITKRGQPVAQVVPFLQGEVLKRQDAAQRIAQLRERMRALYGEQDEMTVREMIETGRKK